MIYSHFQYDTIYPYSLSTSFSLLSNISMYTIPLTPSNFGTQDGVVTNITACINITSQCGITFSGETVCGFYNSGIHPRYSLSKSNFEILKFFIYERLNSLIYLNYDYY